MRSKLLAALSAFLLSSCGVAPPAPSPAAVIDQVNAALADNFTFYVDAVGAVQIKAK